MASSNSIEWTKTLNGIPKYFSRIQIVDYIKQNGKIELSIKGIVSLWKVTYMKHNYVCKTTDRFRIKAVLEKSKKK